MYAVIKLLLIEYCILCLVNLSSAKSKMDRVKRKTDPQRSYSEDGFPILNFTTYRDSLFDSDVCLKHPISDTLSQT